MSLYVGVRAKKSLFFATEQNEAYRAPGPQAEGLDCPCDIEDGSDSSAIILCSGGGMPGVEMRADDDDGARLFAAGDLCNYIVNLSGRTHAVLERETDGDRALSQHSFNEQLVLAADLCHWHGS